VGTSSGEPSKCPSPPLSFPSRGQPRVEKRRGGERPDEVRSTKLGAGSSGVSAPAAWATGGRRRESRRGRVEPPWRCSLPATAVERRDDGAARSPDATVGDGPRRGADDDVCGTATAQPQYPRRRGSSAPPVLPPAAAHSRPRQRWWRRRGRGAALGQMRGWRGRRGRWRQPEEIQSTMGR
jgi:hypothetical protein